MQITFQDDGKYTFTFANSYIFVSCDFDDQGTNWMIPIDKDNILWQEADISDKAREYCEKMFKLKAFW